MNNLPNNYFPSTEEFSKRIDNLNKNLEATLVKGYKLVILDTRTGQTETQIFTNPISRIWAFLESKFLNRGKNYISTKMGPSKLGKSEKKELIVRFSEEFKSISTVFDKLNDATMRKGTLRVLGKIEELDPKLTALQAKMTLLFKDVTLYKPAEINDPIQQAALEDSTLQLKWEQTKFNIEKYMKLRDIIKALPEKKFELTHDLLTYPISFFNEVKETSAYFKELSQQINTTNNQNQTYLSSSTVDKLNQRLKDPKEIFEKTVILKVEEVFKKLENEINESPYKDYKKQLQVYQEMLDHIQTLQEIAPALHQSLIQKSLPLQQALEIKLNQQAEQLTKTLEKKITDIQSQQSLQKEINEGSNEQQKALVQNLIESLNNLHFPKMKDGKLEKTLQLIKLFSEYQLLYTSDSLRQNFAKNLNKLAHELDLPSFNDPQQFALELNLHLNRALNDNFSTQKPIKYQNIQRSIQDYEKKLQFSVPVLKQQRKNLENDLKNAQQAWSTSLEKSLPQSLERLNKRIQEMDQQQGVNQDLFDILIKEKNNLETLMDSFKEHNEFKEIDHLNRVLNQLNKIETNLEEQLGQKTFILEDIFHTLQTELNPSQIFKLNQLLAQTPKENLSLPHPHYFTLLDFAEYTSVALPKDIQQFSNQIKKAQQQEKQVSQYSKESQFLINDLKQHTIMKNIATFDRNFEGLIALEKFREARDIVKNYIDSKNSKDPINKSLAGLLSEQLSLIIDRQNYETQLVEKNKWDQIEQSLKTGTKALKNFISSQTLSSFKTSTGNDMQQLQEEEISLNKQIAAIKNEQKILHEYKPKS